MTFWDFIALAYQQFGGFMADYWPGLALLAACAIVLGLLLSTPEQATEPTTCPLPTPDKPSALDALVEWSNLAEQDQRAAAVLREAEQVAMAAWAESEGRA